MFSNFHPSAFRLFNVLLDMFIIFVARIDSFLGYQEIVIYWEINVIFVLYLNYFFDQNIFLCELVFFNRKARLYNLDVFFLNSFGVSTGICIPSWKMKC